MTLNDLRKASGLSVKDLLERTGVADKTWYKWRDDSDPPKWLWLAVKAVYHRLD